MKKKLIGIFIFVYETLIAQMLQNLVEKTESPVDNKALDYLNLVINEIKKEV